MALRARDLHRATSGVWLKCSLDVQASTALEGRRRRGLASGRAAQDDLADIDAGRQDARRGRRQGMNSYDAIFVGAGHNALVAAAYLARAGWSVLLLERNDRPGGFVRTDELTLPGFKHDTYSSAHPLLVASPVYAELGPDLEACGLRYVSAQYATGVSLEGGGSAVLGHDTAANAAELERLRSGEGAAWTAMIEELGAVAEPIFGLLGMDLTTPAARGLIGALMRGEDGGASRFAADLMRTGREVIQERFASPVTQALLAPWLSHAARPLDRAGGGVWLILTMLALEQGGYCVPIGGSGELATALATVVERNGGEIRCDCEVVQITVADGAATGVRTAGGEAFAARRAVIASTAPDQLYLTLLDESAGVVGSEVRRQAARFRYGGACVQVHLALAEPPRLRGRAPRADRRAAPHARPGRGVAVRQRGGSLPAPRDADDRDRRALEHRRVAHARARSGDGPPADPRPAGPSARRRRRRDRGRRARAGRRTCSSASPTGSSRWRAGTSRTSQGPSSGVP